MERLSEHGNLSSETRMVIICDDHAQSNVHRTLRRLVGYNWHVEEKIGVIVIPRKYRRLRQAVERLIFGRLRACGEMLGLVLIYPGSFLYPVEISQGEFEVRHCDKILFQQLVERNIRRLGLDWFTKALGRLQLVSTDPTPTRLKAWINQFQRIGNFGWIGEELVRLFEVWSSLRIAKELNLNKDTIQQYDYFCVTDTKGGKSAAFMQNLLHSQLKIFDPGISSRIENFKTCFPKMPYTANPVRFLLVEDCIMTGREMVAFFKQIKNYFRSPFDHLMRHKITICFAYTTRLGLLRLEQYLKNNNIQNIEILLPKSGCLENITQAGLEAYRTGALFDEELQLTNHRGFLMSGIDLCLAEVGFTTANAATLRDVCEAIGIQLFRRHLLRRGEVDENVNNYPTYWGFGNEGLGIMTVFGHSIPSSCPSVISLSNEIKWQSVRFLWNALIVPTHS